MAAIDRVVEALAFHRNVGADLDTVRADVRYRLRTPITGKTVRAALKRLEGEGQIVKVGPKWFHTPQGLKLAKGPAVRPAWQPEDFWILMSLFCCRDNQEGVALHDIIAAADVIDRSIPTLEQMHGALNRLASGGLLRMRRSGYVITSKAKDVFTRVQARCGKGVRNRLRGLERLMLCPCCGIPLKKVRWRIAIDEATMKDACASYAESMRA